MEPSRHNGSCLCGAVRFTVKGDLPAPDICHCRACRKQSGHSFASADIAEADLSISGMESLGWYQSSAKVRRGFCTRCGSTLFWDPLERDWTAVAVGAFDGPTGARAHAHIFTAEKSDYYDIADDLPQNL
ncbi:MAG: aldehyde-activating protein [Croceicoccus sp.]|nr:aldehyde-activating protein [Croceicoccus sp.]MAL26785.1 aldehyde-activating protein [Croceicoccus sp.]